MREMMRNFLFFSFNLSVIFSAAAELPNEFAKRCKLHAYSEMTEWMKLDKFYKITSIEDAQVIIPSGEEGINVKIQFDDVSGCNAREMFASCVPLEPTNLDSPLAIEFGMTDCTPSMLVDANVGTEKSIIHRKSTYTQ
jgi:hypothetical protein